MLKKKKNIGLTARSKAWLIEHPIVPTGCTLTPAAAALLLLNEMNVIFVPQGTTSNNSGEPIFSWQRDSREQCVLLHTLLLSAPSLCLGSPCGPRQYRLNPSQTKGSRVQLASTQHLTKENTFSSRRPKKQARSTTVCASFCLNLTS